MSIHTVCCPSVYVSRYVKIKGFFCLPQGQTVTPVGLAALVLHDAVPPRGLFAFCGRAVGVHEYIYISGYE